MRRPLTATGTNLLGLVKHLTGLEYAYLGTALGRPPATPLPWVAAGSIWEGADMWVTADESSTRLLDGYRAACEHADRTIDELSLDAAGVVAHWPPDRRNTTLGALLVRMVGETEQHAGHADIVRELIDGPPATTANSPLRSGTPTSPGSSPPPTASVSRAAELDKCVPGRTSTQNRRTV